LKSQPAIAGSEIGTERRQGAESGTESPEKVPNGVRKAFARRRDTPSNAAGKTPRVVTGTTGPPDPENRSPGAVGAATGTNGKARIDQVKSLPKPNPNASKKQSKSGASQTFSVYDGRTPIGRIERDGSCFRAALLPGGEWLGIGFSSLTDACNAISAATRGCAHA
jgi:hypothetical protein